MNGPFTEDEFIKSMRKTPRSTAKERIIDDLPRLWNGELTENQLLKSLNGVKK